MQSLAGAGSNETSLLELERMAQRDFASLNELNEMDISRLCRASAANLPAIKACIPARYLLLCTTSEQHKLLPAKAFMTALQVGLQHQTCLKFLHHAPLISRT